jgi:hypothetical protein
MASHRIVRIGVEGPHDHIVTVSTASDPDLHGWRWPLGELRRALLAGETFYTLSPATGKRIEVRMERCGVDGCESLTLRTIRGGVDDGGLESLPRIDER